MQRASFPEALVAIALIALFGWALKLATDNYASFKDAWTLLGPLAGIIIGTIPSYFFYREAQTLRVSLERIEGKVDKLS
jgi:hypothetical protein